MLDLSQVPETSEVTERAGLGSQTKSQRLPAAPVYPTLLLLTRAWGYMHRGRGLCDTQQGAPTMCELSSNPYPACDTGNHEKSPGPNTHRHFLAPQGPQPNPSFGFRPHLANSYLHSQHNALFCHLLAAMGSLRCTREDTACLLLLRVLLTTHLTQSGLLVCRFGRIYLVHSKARTTSYVSIFVAIPVLY